VKKSSKGRKLILEINRNIQNIEDEITYFLIINNDLRNKNMNEQTRILSKLNHKIGILFDMYRDYAKLKKKFMIN